MGTISLKQTISNIFSRTEHVVSLKYQKFLSLWLLEGSRLNQLIIIQIFVYAFKRNTKRSMKLSTEKIKNPNRRPVDQIYFEIAIPLLILIFVRSTILT